MKTIDNNRVLEVSQNFKTMQFGIKSKNLGHIIGLLRDEIYSDKILAVIREYSCNAYDANVMAGRGKEPIVVTLPTKLTPEFRVRDFGCGLTAQEIEDIFISYGESTKRNTNDAVGFLGIGAKSGFAYNDNFLVVSYNNGIKTTYNCVLDTTNVGSCLELTRKEMSPTDKDGVEIIIPVKLNDVGFFVSKSSTFFKYWNVKPTLVNYTDTLKNEEKKQPLFKAKDDTWEIWPNDNGGYYGEANSNSVAVMGNIAYPINWKVLRVDNDNAGTAEILKHARLVLRMDIGTLQFAPSREALQYTDFTNRNLNKMFSIIGRDLKDRVKDTFKECKTLQDAMHLYANTFESYGTLFYRNADYSKGLKWKDIDITGSNLDFGKFEFTKGYDANGHKFDIGVRPVVTMYDCANGVVRDLTSNRRRYWGNSRFQVNVGNNVAFVLIDTDKKVYIRKAIKYLKNKDGNLTRFVVMEFGSTKAKDDTFKHLHLDHFNVIRYSTISDDVRKTIIRTHSGGISVKNTTTDYKQYVKYIAKARSSYQDNHLYDAETIDLKATKGYYFSMVSADCYYNNKPIEIRLIRDRVQKILSLACEFLKLDNNTKVYAFGVRIRESKKLKPIVDKNWTSIEKLEGEVMKAVVQSPKFKRWAAHGFVTGNMDFDNHDGLFSLLNKLIKQSNGKMKNNEVQKLLDVLVEYQIPTRNAGNDYNLYDVIGAIAKECKLEKSVDTESSKLKKAMTAFFNKYPMINKYVVRDYECNAYSYRNNNHDVSMLIDYIELCDRCGGNKNS